MACEKKELELNNRTYIVTQWKPEKSMLMKFKLTSIFGDSLFNIIPIIKSMSGKDAKAVMSDDSSMQAIQTMLSTLFEKNTPEAVVTFIKSVLVNISIEYTNDDGDLKYLKITNDSFDKCFEDAEQLDMYKVFFFTIKVNYENLLKGQRA